jgi:hypothetical protein
LPPASTRPAFQSPGSSRINVAQRRARLIAIPYRNTEHISITSSGNDPPGRKEDDGSQEAYHNSQVSEITGLQLLVSPNEPCPRRLIPLYLTHSWTLQVPPAGVEVPSCTPYCPVYLRSRCSLVRHRLVIAFSLARPRKWRQVDLPRRVKTSGRIEI